MRAKFNDGDHVVVTSSGERGFVTCSCSSGAHGHKNYCVNKTKNGNSTLIGNRCFRSSDLKKV
jgi:hypothetical protein